MFALALRLQKTSSRRLGQDQYICLDHMSSRRLQDVFKTSSRRLQDLFKASSRRLQDVFEMSSRHLQDFPQRYLQDVFKAYHQVNLFYLTRPREVFNTFLSTEEFAWVTLFLRNLWSVYKICERDIKLSSFSFSPYYTFSWLLTEAYLESGPTSTMAFFAEIFNFLGSLKMVL